MVLSLLSQLTLSKLNEFSSKIGWEIPHSLPNLDLIIKTTKKKKGAVEGPKALEKAFLVDLNLLLMKSTQTNAGPFQISFNVGLDKRLCILNKTQPMFTQFSKAAEIALILCLFLCNDL